jgi:HSP20 family protein
MPWFEKIMEKSFPVDVIDHLDKIIVRAELPGVAKKNISIKAVDRTLEIKAEHLQEKKELGETMFMQERRYGWFYRVIPLPTEVEAEKAEASLEDGILEVVLPKKR